MREVFSRASAELLPFRPLLNNFRNTFEIINTEIYVSFKDAPKYNNNILNNNRNNFTITKMRF